MLASNPDIKSISVNVITNTEKQSVVKPLKLRACGETSEEEKSRTHAI